MRRIAWFLAAVLLLAGSVTAYQTYPAQKWWLRAGYVKLFQVANWLTGNDFPPPDRFK